MLYLDIELLVIPLALAAAGTLVGGAIVFWLWQWVPALWRRRLMPVIFVAFCLLVAFAATFSLRPDWDEVEHLHAAWLMAHGQLPYRDFFQHHTPTLWLMLAPFVGRMQPDAIICVIVRLGGLLTSALGCVLAVAMANRYAADDASPALTSTPAEPPPQARLSWPVYGVGAAVFILWLSLVEPLELSLLRPDLFANALSLAAFLMLLRSRHPATVFITGLLLGAAASFTPKHLPLFVVLPLCIWWEHLGWRRCLWLAALHISGFLLGIAPLAAWFVIHHLTSAVPQWILAFNRDPKLQIGGLLPLIPTLLAGVYWARIRAYQFRHLQPAQRMLFVAALVALSMYLIQPFHKSVYGLQMFAYLAIIVGAPLGLTLISRMLRARRFLMTGALIGLLFSQTFVVASYWMGRWDFYWGMQGMASLIAQSQGGPVVLVAPEHPVFALDATDLSHPWQWNKWLNRPPVKERLEGIVEKIIQSRPTIVLAGKPDLADDDDREPFDHKPARGMLADRLVKFDAISPQQGDRLQRFLVQNYRLVLIVTDYYWVRNDLPLAEGVTPVAVD